MKLCNKCGTEIKGKRLQKPNVKFCSDVCSKNYHYHTNTGIENNSRYGAIAEHLVIADLLIRDWQVFTAVYGAQSVDLMAYKSNHKVKIQVKVGYITDAGIIRHAPLHNHEHDILAIVLNDDHQVIYRPALPQCPTIAQEGSGSTEESNPSPIST